MKVSEWIASVLGFRTIPTTIIVALAYLAIFTSVFVTDQLPKIPKNRKGLNFEEAYSDLHHITAQPHPYHSHANEVVHSYILSRIQDVASRYPHVHVVNDLTSNASWATGSYGVYFEGTNILVKVDGSDNRYLKSGGILFSAHYDSVSTAPGVTDDGMGVVTLMQLIEYFAKNRPKRTAVFNINNGEEGGLNGAHAFLKHPWANISDTFLNLEGASAGGRPILFRATSTGPLLSFLPKYVPHPHANVLSADAFSRGVIRSATDYTVYTQRANMEGLDLAFYKGRSKYHTKYDAIPFTEGHEKSLWSMMEASRGAGLALVNDERKEENRKGGIPVYFDLFAAALIVFSLSAMFTFNVVFLVVGPIVLILLVVVDHILQHSRRQQENGSVHGPVNSIFQDLWAWLIEFGWLAGVWRWAKFWLAVVVTIGLQTLLVLGFIKLNPFIVYSSPYLVLLSDLCLAYLSLVLILRLPISAPRGFSLPEQQKQTVLIQLYTFTWALLLLSTIAISKANIGGLYFISVWNALVFVACVLGCVEDMFKAHGTQSELANRPRVRFGAPPQRVEAEEEEEEEEPSEEAEATEHTPLIQQHQQPGPSLRRSEKEESGAIGWWILQLLIIVPAPVILVSQIGNLLMDAMAQTLADGSSAVTVYAAASLIAFLLVLPLTPFSFKIHLGVAAIFGAVFIVITAYAWLVFPFSQDAPLKVFFEQKVVLDDVSSAANMGNEFGVQSVVTALTGAKYYLQKIIPKLPSAAQKDITCHPDTAKPGLWTCEWNSDLIPVPGGQGSSGPGSMKDAWFTTAVIRRNATSARFIIQGQNSRLCHIYFDNRRIREYVVHGSDGNIQNNFESSGSGLNEIRLWSRTWNREFEVDVELNQNDELKGRVACDWAEYESATVDNGSGLSQKKAKIPAFEEVLSFLPKWAVVSKTAEGLVQASSSFTI
ncbi:hypothetical protein BDQ12DRAFT_681281 [Crucibulum laeve]|uniref:Peptide hydrolase n=1 Tax=Crucibulum laeve TaxID=68775 RepID=A0A5C3MF65_9AGAR|nr:hypothetical protein BDQ12DRAFT_681281 [Crucibulum laeve]